MTAKLHQSLEARAEAIRAGQSTVKQDYTLRNGVSQLRLMMASLDERVVFYEELMAHEKTNWSKVFIRDASCTPELLHKRS